MVLSDSAIIEAIGKGLITITDFDESRLNSCSVDIRIGNKIKYTKNDIIDFKKPDEMIEEEISSEGYLLQPNKGYLMVANGIIGVDGNVMAQVKAKSSCGRKFLDIIIGPAGHIEPNWKGELVLELRSTQPTIIYPYLTLAQLEFSYISGRINKYYGDVPTSKYMNQKGIQESLNHLNFQ